MTRVFNRQAEKKRRQSLRNSLSPSEVILWSRLRNREVCAQKFRRQFSVGPYLLDFYCPALRLAIEIDGDSHFQLGEQEKDRTRQQFIEATGIQFLRFRNVEVRENLRGVLEAIYRKIQALNETV